MPAFNRDRHPRRALLFAASILLAGFAVSGAEQPAPVVKSVEPFGLARGPFVMDGNPGEWGPIIKKEEGSVIFKSSHLEFWGGNLKEGFTGDISIFDSRGQVIAMSRLAYDATNLYCAVIVLGAPLANHSSSPQELIYGGDSIGLCMGPIGGKGTNQRFICGLYAGKPTVVAMREQWPESKPYTYFTEASGKVTLPFVAPLATAQ